MYEVLFDGKRKVSNQEVIDRMNYFIRKAKYGQELYTTEKKACLQLARELRKELEAEYKNNSLNRIKKAYENHELFEGCFRPAVHEALVSITGPFSYEYGKLYSFLADVEFYMNYYLPSKYKNRKSTL